MKDKMQQLGGFTHFLCYLEHYIYVSDVSIIFLDVERFYRVFNHKDNDCAIFFDLLGKKRLFPFLFDDAVFRKCNLKIINKLKFEKILTACPLSVLKYKEIMIDAAFFPLEGHEKWYFGGNDIECDIDVLFYGTLKKGSRQEQLNAIQDAGLSVTHVGDEKRSLSCYDLCEYIRRSKIVINFSKSFSGPIGTTWYHPDGEVCYQFKGRILEAGFCGTLCVTETNPAANLMFGKLLPQFSSTKECINLLKLYLSDATLYEDTRSNFVKACENYRPVHILKTIF